LTRRRGRGSIRKTAAGADAEAGREPACLGKRTNVNEARSSVQTAPGAAASARGLVDGPMVNDQGLAGADLDASHALAALRLAVALGELLENDPGRRVRWAALALRGRRARAADRCAHSSDQSRGRAREA
jgi:hypothetical protein